MTFDALIDHAVRETSRYCRRCERVIGPLGASGKTGRPSTRCASCQPRRSPGAIARDRSRQAAYYARNRERWATTYAEARRQREREAVHA